MKTKIYILVLLFLAIMGFMNAQADSQKMNFRISDFNFYFWNAYADKLHLKTSERTEFLLSLQRNDADFQKRPKAQALTLPGIFLLWRREEISLLDLGIVRQAARPTGTSKHFG